MYVHPKLIKCLNDNAVLKTMDSKANDVEEKLKAVAEVVKALNLPLTKLGKIVDNFLTNCKPIGGKKSETHVPVEKES